MKKYVLFLMIIAAGYSSVFAQKRIIPEEANKHVGQKVTITGKIVGGKLIQKTKKQSTLLTMGNTPSNPPVTIIINAEDRQNFPYKPEEYFSHKTVSVTGFVSNYNGKAGVLIKGPDDIKIEENGAGMEFKPLEFEGFNRFFQD